MKKILTIGLITVVVAGVAAIADALYQKGVEDGIDLAQEDFDFSEKEDEEFDEGDELFSEK